MTHVVPALLAVAALACGGKAAPAGPEPAEVRAQREPVRPFATALFAGQQIAVVPLTLVLMPDSVARAVPLSDRAAALQWADSLLAAALAERGPEVKWQPPVELRKVARRAPGIAPDPDRMGQAILRAPKLKDVPEPLQTQLRSLLALTGGRYALVPAALAFETLPAGGVRAEFSLALVDSRTAKVIWRTLAWGDGADARQALGVTFVALLPTELNIQ